jgi:hypothetical protein
MSKQRGALMSSRLIPPKDGAIAATISTIRSASLVSSTIGTASRPANSLNRQAFPSITGSDAAGPMSPRPSTAVPSETTATTRGAHVNREGGVVGETVGGVWLPGAHGPAG